MSRSTVTRLVIGSRRPFAEGRAFGTVGSYEQLDGRVYFTVDPDDPINGLITDLRLTPRDAAGLVHYSADWRIVRPVEAQRGNHRLLFDVLNRGRATAFRYLNVAPETAPGEPVHAGDGFLMRSGYTVASCGWQHDVPAVPGLMRAYPAEAVTRQGPITGRIAVTFQLNAPATVQFLADRMHRPYPTHDLEDATAVLTEQDHEDAPERVVPRDQWSFARVENGCLVRDATHVHRASGFIPGKVYQVIYTAVGAPIVGLGLLAIRDFASFLRYGTREEGNPCAADLEHAYALGVSQTGRLLRHFLYLGLNQDERERAVFDGVAVHSAGGKHGEFNVRVAQPSSQASRSANNRFPFSDVEQTDSETGRTDGLMTRLAARGKVPKLLYTCTSSEYWGGHAALVHIDLAGVRDLDLPANVRMYYCAGTQHSLPAFPLQDTDRAQGYRGRHAFNWLDCRPLLRAALVNLDRWVSAEEPPPPSRYPRLDAGTAVPPESLASRFEGIPGVGFPAPLRRFRRLDFGTEDGVATHVPPRVGAPYPCFVPAVDRDGNETCGVRLPAHQVPLATYTGWNLRHADIGGAGQILAAGGGSGGSLVGATIPFPLTLQAREAAGDPRPALSERYASRADYLERVGAAAQSLVDQRYMLAEDVDNVIALAAKQYDALSGH